MNPASPALLQVEDLHVHFPVDRGLLRPSRHWVRAVNGVSFELAAGETIGLVGESGCGKSTLGRAVIRLLPATAGRIVFDGTDLATLRDAELRPLRRQFQMIFQDPYGSLNPRHTVEDILGEALDLHRLAPTPAARTRRIAELLAAVGLDPAHARRYPHEFSGGQRQRLGIARALAVEPRLIVCDEPVSALDVSIQSQVLNLMLDLQREMQLSYLFIAHNLAVVKHVSDRIAIMYLGRIVELADAETIYRAPRHPYTRALISAIPEPDPTRNKQRIVLQGDVPSPINPPSGCPFHPRCPHATERCRAEVPALRSVGEAGQQISCHYDL